MVFDWTKEEMIRAKKASTICFWTLIVIVVIQWLVLTLRDVSGIGFFSFFEYA